MGPQAPHTAPVFSRKPASSGLGLLLAAALLFFFNGVLKGASVPAAGLQAPEQSVSSAAAREHFSEAQQFLQQGNTDAALTAAQAGLKLAPRSVEGLNLLGVICGQKRDF